jgi:hypothetical protein
MARHQLATASTGRARIALGALPLVATVGAIGVGSVVMSPASSDMPLEPPIAAGIAGAPAAVLPLGPGVPPPPVTVLDLAATGGSALPGQGVPGGTAGSVRSAAGDDSRATGRSMRSAATAVGGSPRITPIRDAATPARGGSSVGGSAAATSGGSGSGGGGNDSDDGGGSGGSNGGAGGAASAGSGSGSGGGGGNDSDDSDDGGGSSASGGSNRGLVGGVVGGLGSTLHGATSLLSFGESSPSVLSFGS